MPTEFPLFRKLTDGKIWFVRLADRQDRSIGSCLILVVLNLRLIISYYRHFGILQRKIIISRTVGHFESCFAVGYIFKMWSHKSPGCMNAATTFGWKLITGRSQMMSHYYFMLRYLLSRANPDRDRAQLSEMGIVRICGPYNDPLTNDIWHKAKKLSFVNNLSLQN